MNVFSCMKHKIIEMQYFEKQKIYIGSIVDKCNIRATRDKHKLFWFKRAAHFNKEARLPGLQKNVWQIFRDDVIGEAISYILI